jgi:hypothetical protein
MLARISTATDSGGLRRIATRIATEARRSALLNGFPRTPCPGSTGTVCGFVLHSTRPQSSWQGRAVRSIMMGGAKGTWDALPRCQRRARQVVHPHHEEWSNYVPGAANQLITGYVKTTLCGLTASRYVNVFTPSEASCRECKRRWQLAVAADATKAASAPPRSSPPNARAGNRGQRPPGRHAA